MLKRLLLVVVIFAIVVAGALELVLPMIVSKELSRGLQETFGTGADMTVKLRPFPAVRMLTGYLGTVSVVTTEVPAGSLTLDSLAVTMNDVSVNMSDLLSRKTLKVTRASNTKVVITVSQANLLDCLATEAAFAEPSFVVHPDLAIMGGYLVVGEKKVPVSFEGRFVLQDERWVRFELSGASVGNVAVPRDFLGSFLSLVGSPELAFDLSKFPLPLKALGVRQEEGRLIIEAGSQ